MSIFVGSSANVAFLDSGMDPTKEATEVSTTKVQTLNYAEICYTEYQELCHWGNFQLQGPPTKKTKNKQIKTIKRLKPPISPLGIIYLSVGIVKQKIHMAGGSTQSPWMNGKKKNQEIQVPRASLKNTINLIYVIWFKHLLISLYSGMIIAVIHTFDTAYYVVAPLLQDCLEW